MVKSKPASTENDAQNEEQNRTNHCECYRTTCVPDTHSLSDQREEETTTDNQSVCREDDQAHTQHQSTLCNKVEPVPATRKQVEMAESVEARVEHEQYCKGEWCLRFIRFSQIHPRAE